MFRKLQNLYKLLNELFHSPKNEPYKKSDFIFISHDVNKGDLFNGKAFCKILDSVQLALLEQGFKVLCLTFPDCNLIGDKTWNYVLSIKREYIRSAIKNMIKRKFLANNKFENYFKLILDVVQPRAVVGMNLNDDIILAARELGIPTVEVLHGLGYVPPLQPEWRNKPVEKLPNFFVCLDQKSYETFTQLNDKSKQVLCKHPYYNSNFEKRHLNEFSLIGLKIRDRTIGKKIILLGLTWGYAGDHGPFVEFKDVLPNGFYPEFIEDLIQNDKSCFWLIRVHPIHLRKKEQYKNLFNKLDSLMKYGNVDWEIASESPLSLLFQFVDVHLCMASMISYDAAIFGVPTLFMCPITFKDRLGNYPFKELIDRGYANVALPNDTYYITDWISQNLSKKREKFQLNDSCLSVSDFLTNIN